MRHLILPMLCLTLSACAALQTGRDAAPETDAAPQTTAPPPRPDARTVEEFDTTSAAERASAAARPAAVGERELGRTVASLGDPSEPGFWARTPLVRTPAKGRLSYPATGASVQVDLIPLDAEAGAGSQVSLAAMRLLGAPLTALPELIVYGP